ncbi:DNA polymerase III, subunit gamma and tau [Moorena producens PAL-8-15-08-1]|uniref:DNA polymerase III subunit gamma/tau n=1 Tax=Moorena producens PAL-8-15-08-1 TaxID=1458985 RepID=A0A1D8U0G7_9CYAN|nr:DNA polymerase III subunit gamma/tau [Moorena producens]AOX03409.1 DNA polymerase III, subunit gamma and tau [Moorena producens PAL-8-15-08-1]
MSYEPLHHKYRPQRFADLVGQDAIAKTLTNAIESERIAPAYLFTGPRGTGKTSSARILAKSLNCLKTNLPTPLPCGECQVCREIAGGLALDVTEMDAASHTGVDNIREIIERAQFAPVQCRYKVYVIDECHMLSTAAFNSLLKTLEEPPERVVFILATTDPQRVLPTIISRCQRFDFRRIPLEAMVSHLKAIAVKENIAITPDALTVVAQVAQGGLRDAESLLDQLSLLDEQVTVEQVWDLVGAVPEQDLLALLNAIASSEPVAVLEQCGYLIDRGREPLVILQNLASFYRDLLIAKTAPARNNLSAITLPSWQKLCELAIQLDLESILRGQQHLKDSELQIKNTTQPRLWLEVTLMGLLPGALASESLETSQLSPKNPSVKPSAPAVKPRHQPNLAPVGRHQPRKEQYNQPSSGRDQTTPKPEHPSKQAQKPKTQQQTDEPKPPERLGFQPHPDTSSNGIPKTPDLVSTSTSNQAVDHSARVERDSEVSNQPYQIEQVWQQVIHNIELDGSREILRSNGCLLAFNGREASIGIKKKGVQKLIQGMLPQIQKAFAKVHPGHVKVNFQLVGANPSQTAPQSRVTLPAVPTQKLPPPITTPEAPQESSNSKGDSKGDSTEAKLVVPPSTSDSSKTAVNPSPQPSQPENLTPPSNSETSEAAETVLSSPALSSPALSSPVLSRPAYDFPDLGWDADQIEQALGKIKDSFGGEIIDLNDELSNNEVMPKEPLVESFVKDTQGTFDQEQPESSVAENQPDPRPFSIKIQNRPQELEYDENGELPF